jgi:hypothetical protein
MNETPCSRRPQLRGILLTFALALPFAPACDKAEGSGGGSDDKKAAPKVVGSCDAREAPGVKFKVCNEYTGSNWTKKEIQARCTPDGHTFIDGPCPTDGIVTSCKVMGGKPMESTSRYYDKKDEAVEACKTIGGESS